MKCLKKNEIVKRVQEQSVKGLINSGWVFCPKSEWKVAKAGKPSTSHDEAVVEAVKAVKKDKNKKVKKQKVEEVAPVAETVVPEVPKVIKKAKKVTVEA